MRDNGEPETLIPGFIGPANFFMLDEPIPLPGDIDIQSIDGDHSQVDIAPIWDAVSELGLTNSVPHENTVFALYLYQPSPAPAHSENWDWTFMLHQQ